MCQEPLVGIVIVHKQGYCGQYQGGYQEVLVVVHEECIAEANAQGNACLPPQEVHALRCSSLAMAAQLDEEEQESGADDANRES